MTYAELCQSSVFTLSCNLFAGMNGKAWIFLLLFVAGLIVLLLPDNGNRILTLNEKHGPSLQDLIGLGMMLIAWLYSCLVIIKNVQYLRKKLGEGRLILFLSIYILSIAGICISLNVTSNVFFVVIYSTGNDGESDIDIFCFPEKSGI